jgi:hypothetical protein
MRLFPAINSLVHFERKIKQYFRFKHIQAYASPCSIADICVLHASDLICGEDQGVMLPKMYLGVMSSWNLDVMCYVFTNKCIKAMFKELQRWTL